MNKQLPVVECFHSLQGEGAHFGQSAFFIRLASCKVGCPWCDTKHSWNESIHPKKTIIELSNETAKAVEQGAAFVVLTGGEPLHHNLDELCNSIRKITSLTKLKFPISIHLETSGVNQLSGSPNWITLSPKPHAPPSIELLTACQELKVVINDVEDLIFAEEMANKARHAQKKKIHSGLRGSESSLKPLLFLQPCWGQRKSEKLVVEYIKNHPHWRLSIQTHKWLKIS